MRVVCSDGVSLHYQDSGGGGPVLFLVHGFGSGSAVWAPQLEALSGRYRCISWDMRGHAQSDCPDDPGLYSKQRQVDDMNAVLDACRVHSAVFVGHSMGAYDSLLYFLSAPENAARVRALVIFASGPGFRKQPARDRWNAQCQKLSLRYRERGVAGLVGSDRKMGHKTAVGLMHAAARVMAHCEDDPLFVRLGGTSVAAASLDRVKVPALIIIGERDKGFLRSSEMMQTKLPEARMVLVAGAGHMANEQAPELFNKHLIEFIESLSRAKL